MGLPSKKRTKSSARERASHFALKNINGTKCTNCGASILSHRACPKCGYFKGEKKIATKGRVNKK